MKHESPEIILKLQNYLLIHSIISAAQNLSTQCPLFLNNCIFLSYSYSQMSLPKGKLNFISCNAEPLECCAEIEGAFKHFFLVWLSDTVMITIQTEPVIARCNALHLSYNNKNCTFSMGAAEKKDNNYYRTQAFRKQHGKFRMY